MKTANDEKRVMVKSSLGWLDGFDGDNYEWTRNRATAWRLRKSDAEGRIERICKQTPDAEIVEA